MGSGARRWMSLVMLLGLGAMASGAPASGGVATAYFYKPPLDGTTAQFIARHFTLVILTENDQGYARQLRRDGYRGLILQSVDGGEVEGPGPYWRRPRHCDCNYRPYQYSLADQRGMFCRQINGHEAWFLHDLEGRRILSRFRSAGGIERTNYAMNPAARGWRRFAARRLKADRRLGFDGVFLDNIALSRAGWLGKVAGAKGVREFATGAAWRRAMAGYLDYLRGALGSEAIWANLTHDPGTADAWRRYLPALNGVMVEDFLLGWRSYALPVAAREAQMIKVRRALAAGRSVLLVAQGGRRQGQRLRAALAGYWLLRPRPGAAGHLYFRYADANDLAYRTVWWYPLYTRSPGAPRGPARRVGAVWRRRFAAGWVRLNMATLSARLAP
ncbi:MAG: putative glycoside hydrolase [Terriglobales bacterium]